MAHTGTHTHFHKCVNEHTWACECNMQCSKANWQTRSFIHTLTHMHIHSVCSVTLSDMWSVQNTSNKTMDDSYEVCVCACVCLTVSGVKHNAWPSAWQILAGALDPDHTRTGRENNCVNTHLHKYTCTTHMHTCTCNNVGGKLCFNSFFLSFEAYFGIALYFTTWNHMKTWYWFSAWTCCLLMQQD